MLHHWSYCDSNRDVVTCRLSLRLIWSHCCYTPRNFTPTYQYSPPVKPQLLPPHLSERMPFTTPILCPIPWWEMTKIRMNCIPRRIPFPTLKPAMVSRSRRKVMTCLSWSMMTLRLLAMFGSGKEASCLGRKIYRSRAKQGLDGEVDWWKVFEWISPLAVTRWPRFMGVGEMRRTIRIERTPLGLGTHSGVGGIFSIRSIEGSEGRICWGWHFFSAAELEHGPPLATSELKRVLTAASSVSSLCIQSLVDLSASLYNTIIRVCDNSHLDDLVWYVSYVWYDNYN